MRHVNSVRRRKWADLVVLFASLWAFAWAIWAPPSTEMEGGAVRSLAGWWAAHAIGGALGLLSLFLAPRWRPLARVVLVVAACALLVGAFTSGRAAGAAALTLAVPGVLLLVAAPFIGPVPSPQEEERAG